MSDCLRLKKSNCKNCYKCIRHCPVKSIRFSGNQAHIIADDCILCGTCFVVCPQDAKEIVSELEKVKLMLMARDHVVVSLAPSFAARFEGIGIEGMRAALSALGFAEVEETAIGATMVAREYDRMLAQGTQDIVISSCCHSVNLLIQKHFPDELIYLADVMSPMQAHCADIKKRNPQARTVFIGPCVAKKDEGQDSRDIVDAVLTFEELAEWLEEEGIELSAPLKDAPGGRARLFPTTGGILKTMTCSEADYEYMAVDGIDNCMAVLEDIESGKVSNCFIEMSMCSGSCVGGPVMGKQRRSPVCDYLAVARFAGNKQFEVQQPSAQELQKGFEVMVSDSRIPSDAEIQSVLRQMGKTTADQELNCGTCGYDTCREKAIAILQGKAEISMCLPYLKDKAEAVSSGIAEYTPNGIVILNDQLEIQQVNPAALRILNLRDESVLLGEHVESVLDTEPFEQAMEEGKSVQHERKYLADCERYVDQTIVPTEDDHTLICIMRDVTNKVEAQVAQEELSRQTAEIADEMVNKQMRVVQEIASLLGETTAETKIALTKLKETVVHG
ncbi:MAG: PAS domain-containing protein [Atopobiaceae bacterium]|nr:PAS domain-containing protein [Atopobiaceae bacterium]